MPLPWKKAKGKRFSQLVTSHLNTPKRGASLVVETGFPTSLADLFVKNRDRFNNNNNTDININGNNHTKKKKKKRTSPNFASRISIPPPPAAAAHCLLPISSDSSNLSTPSTLLPLQASIPPSPHPFSPGCDEIVPLNVDDEAVNGKKVLIATLKMFFVVVMALGTKRFAVGITISALVLLLMEYAGTYLGGWFVKPPEIVLFWIAKFSCSLRLKRQKNLMICLEDDNTEIPTSREETRTNPRSVLVPETCAVQSNPTMFRSSSPSFSSSFKMKDLISEVLVIQSSSNSVPPIQEIPSVKYEFNLRNGKEKWATEEIRSNRGEVVIEEQEAHTSERSDGITGRARRGKMGSKIKKLANKLNASSKKKPKESTKVDAGSSLVGGDSKGKLITHEQGEECEVDFNDETISPISSVRKCNNDRIIAEGVMTPLFEDLLEDNKLHPVNEWGTATRDANKKSYYPLYLAIVLLGLLGGRLVALAVTTSCWYLLLMFGTKLTEMHALLNRCS